MTAPTPTVLAVTALARQRLALGTGSEVGYFTDSHPYVPGSVLRGALAAAWITENGPPGPGNPATSQFHTLFDGTIRYGNLRPDGSHRTPLSVYTCKYPADDACKTTVVDQAFATGDYCPGCGLRLEQSRGDLNHGPKLTRITRTSIDPATGTAKDGELYANAALPAGTSLSGLIHGHHPWLAQPRTVWLGGRRTIGGQTELTTADHHTPQPTPVAPGQDLVIRLAGPAIFVDLAGRPRLDPEPTLDLFPGTTVTSSWTRAATWSGWHAAARLPKPTELCATAGSTYRIAGPPDTLTRLAATLLRNGIGLRRTEGFGEITIATHAWQTHQRPGQQSRQPGSSPYQELLDLGLDDTAWQWLTGTLRALQIEQQRTGGAPITAQLLHDLLAQPAAADLHGEQRKSLRDRLLGISADDLRELTTLVLATDRPRTGRR